MTASRRTVLTAGAAALGTALLNGCSSARYAGPDRTLTIASGQRGGLYVEFANLLAAQVTALEPDLRCAVKETNGSIHNVLSVRDREADLGVVQADVARAAINGEAPFTGPVAIRGIGRVYEDYLQLVVRADSPLTKLSELAGRSVSLGTSGSGTAMISQRMMAAAGVEVFGRFESLDSAVTSLAKREIDALVWCGGVPTPALVKVHEQVGIRVLPLDHLLPKLRSGHVNTYQPVRLPAGTYKQSETPTIGVANLLVCAKTLPADVAAAVTRTLVLRANRLVPPTVVGTQFLDPHTLIGTLDVPLHAGAAAAYRDLHG
ncbi:MAG TPA: TAXI family TRAP transporter solute-binding subunit [Actinophytocola sp.]|uniref:TAXI family TRAP transporter solute-binding subunit n=1 Tax=Actinophytocola sp. TaxID=1872138 RepID=UPI002DB61A28|nr:TAXI family TRAP transporter solute-binding subunit [Actinophytocola sp.]HEU5475062.1 TAXI family TRAP transporter solute-binding subunit [Actinophytocola sp.]